MRVSKLKKSFLTNEITRGYKYADVKTGGMDRQACIRNARSSELISEPPERTSLLMRQLIYNGSNFMHSGRIN